MCVCGGGGGGGGGWNFSMNYNNVPSQRNLFITYKIRKNRLIYFFNIALNTASTIQQTQANMI